jgi:hypothetical protein
MSYAKRQRDKHKSFVMLSRAMLDMPEWRKLSASAKLAYIYIKNGFTGRNNGGITVSYASLSGVKGLSSSGTIAKGLRELETNGWIRRANHGGLPRLPNTYELTGNYDEYL